MSRILRVINLFIVRCVEGELEGLGLPDGRRDDLPLAPAKLRYLDGRSRGHGHLEEYFVYKD